MRLWLSCLCGLFLFMGVAGGLTANARADFLLYTVPDTDLTFLLSGEIKVNPGATVTLKHVRGTLHFPLSDVVILKAQSNAKAYSLALRAARNKASTGALIDAAKQGLHLGLLEESRQALAEAWKLNAKDPTIARLAAAMPHFSKPVQQSAAIEDGMRKFLGRSDLKVERSAHFVLMHDLSDKPDPKTKKKPATKRLELLEKVYQSFFLDFAIGGKFMRPPAEPLQVVTFAKHADYLNFVRRIDPQLKHAAGFYDPKANIAIFYDQKTDESYEELDRLMKLLAKLRDAVKGTQGAGDLIRLVNSLELLIEIAKEDQDIEVLTHECTHQLAANAGLIPRNSLFVRWTHEGLAAYCESPKQATWSGIGSVNKERLSYYRVLQNDPVHGSIEYLVTDRVFDYAQTNGAVLAAYGQAWALTHFLMNTRFEKLMEFYDRVGKLPDVDLKNWGEAQRAQLLLTFDEVFGDRRALEAEWRQYMSGLKTDLEKLVED